MKRNFAIGSRLLVLLLSTLALPTFAQTARPVDASTREQQPATTSNTATGQERKMPALRELMDDAKNPNLLPDMGPPVTSQTQIPWQLRDNEEGDTEQDRQERKQFEKDIQQDRLQVLAISTAVINNSRETQKLIEKAVRQMHFQGSIQAESLARDIVFPPQEPPACIDSRMLISMLQGPPRCKRMDQWTAIQLYQRIRDAVDQAIGAYREYSAVSRLVYRSTSSLKTLEEMVKECCLTDNPAKHIEMDTVLEKANLDLQEVTAKRSKARQTIVDLAGEGVACGVDERLKVAERDFQRNR